ncbi:Serine carboxypeptidase-like 45 [Linum grandiflorum]
MKQQRRREWGSVVSTAMTVLVLSMATTSTESSREADKVTGLPGQPAVGFNQYSGYVTVDKMQGRALFYYFVEAESDPNSKPLVLWLNGGPGCSSVGAGAFCEHGPFKPSGDVLVKNDHSWNKEANMLYLESPAGVGFSYSSNSSFYNSVNDHITASCVFFSLFTAQDNLLFLEGWLAKFPEFKGRDLLITGESYAGHYVPQLAQLIIKSKSHINLKAIAIGNPLLDFNTDFNARAEYFWSHGLISDATYEVFNKVCNYSQIRRQLQRGFLTPDCFRVHTQSSHEIGKFVDAYDVTLDVCLSSVQSQSRVLDIAGKVDVCVEDETIKYLNRKDVQKAFHARLVGVKTWSTCSDVVRYEMENLETPTTPILGQLLKSGVKVLVYSGDQDSVIPLTGTRKVVDGLAKQMGLNTSVPYSSWFQGSQVAGWTQVYGDVLSFATIRGASHEAPFSQPERSLVLFKAFLGGTHLPANSVSY